MKKVTMTIRQIKTGAEHQETYEIKNEQDGKEYAEGLIEFFNETLRPNESARELVQVHEEIMDECQTEKKEHQWEKQNLTTISRGGRMYDIYECTCCGITGKRYGLSSTVKRDGKYQAEKYAYCGQVHK